MEERERWSPKQMVSSSSNNSNNNEQAPRVRKRVDVEPGSLKRAPNGSAFTRCDHCKKDVPIAIADMHDCGMDEATKSRLRQNVTTTKPAPEPAKKKTEERKKQKGGEKKKAKQTKELKSSKKAKKDPNMPKKPLTAFFVFMEDFRKAKKEEKATVKPSEMTKLGGERWKEMTDEEKAPYSERAAKLKEEYDAAMTNYKNGDKGDDNAEDDSTAEADEEES